MSRDNGEVDLTKVEEAAAEPEEAGGFVLKSVAPDKPLPLLEGLTRTEGKNWMDTVSARLAAQPRPESGKLRRSLDRLRRS